MERLRQMLEKAEAPLSPTTLVELRGRRRVLVEGHRGILGYGRDEILVATAEGVLHISGRDLQLCSMSREQLFVSGTIDAIVCEGEKA